MTKSRVSQIQMAAFNYSINDWAITSGQTLSIDDFFMLYSRLGNQFGGNNKTFQLPNLSPIDKVNYIIQLYEKEGSFVDTVGEIVLWPAERLPEGWIPCDGQILLQSEAQLLYTVIETKFGQGPNQETFQVPQISCPYDHMQYIICGQGVLPDKMFGYVGSIRYFAGGDVYKGYRDGIKCQGQALPIGTYESLYDVTNQRWGATTTTFNLPKIDDLIPGVSAYICSHGTYPARD